LIQVDGATGSYDTLLNKKAEAICSALCRDYQFGFLHVKAVDDAGHDQDIDLKCRLIEQIDRMIGQIIKRLWTAFKSDLSPVLVVTSDHSTPAVLGDHSNDPVPFCITHLDKAVLPKQGISLF